ncbi:MAG TPA: hypothetical protein VLM38_18460 [Blastocatellia bacterium]|nr:hypothetical protein [Blastocatellia bacterium]
MHHKSIVCSAVAACFALSLITVETPAFSDWIAVYARIDKVVLEPNDTAPERIQIWGAFALANKLNNNDYQPAQRGYLYYSIKPGKETACRAEWSDLKKIAGTESIVGFGSRSSAGRLRKADEKPADPDVYGGGFGLVKMSDRGTEYPPIRELRALPKR